MNKKSIPVLLIACGFILASCGGGQRSSDSSSSATDTGASTGSSDTSATDTGTTSSESSTDTGPSYPIAHGAKEFVSSTNAERTKILGKLEKYAVDIGLTGLPLFENGGYNIVSSRVVKGTETYIPNYGFSTFRDGRPNGTLSGETNPDLANYYHSWESSDPQTINGLNAEGSQVLDLFSTIQSGFFSTRLNARKTGYEWYGLLAAKDRPWYVGEDGKAHEADSTELHDTWRIYVRTGSNGAAYRTFSKDPARAAFDGRPIQLEDYLTPFKVLLTKKNGYYRGGELAGKQDSTGIVGAGTFYDATAEGYSEDAWKSVGIKTGTDENGDYVDFRLMTPANRFYAMYNLSSSLYCPLPMEFFNLVTDNGAAPGNYGSYTSDKHFTPVDNILSVGALALEAWNEDQSIIFKTNRDWWEIKENPDLYRWDGEHLEVISGYSTDRTLPFKEYQAGKLDSVGIPTQYLKDYRDNPLAAQVPGSSTFKLNTNTCDEETWVELFGKNGSVFQTESEADYWDVKPWMNNNNFVRGIFYALDRENFATTRGVIPSINYFADAYLSDPENGISYNSTEEHAEALDNFWGSTVETYGYSEALSTAAFTRAIEELIASGDLTEDTESVDIDLVWMYDTDVKEYGEELVGYMEKTFNQAAEDLGYDFILNVRQSVGGPTYEGVYDKISEGQFDLAFGAISGNTLNPIDFLEVLKSDNSSGFTLNWGKDTSYVETGKDAIVYNEEIYSFDGLFGAANAGIILDEEGYAIAPATMDLDSTKSYLDVSGEVPTLHVEGKMNVLNDPALEMYAFDFFAQSGIANDYFEAYEVGYADYYQAGTTADPLEVDEEGNFSVTIYGKLPENMATLSVAQASKGFIQQDGDKLYTVLARYGLDCDKYINGLYLGIDGPCKGVMMNDLDWIEIILPEEEEQSTEEALSEQSGSEAVRLNLTSKTFDLVF